MFNGGCAAPYTMAVRVRVGVRVRLCPPPYTMADAFAVTAVSAYAT